MASRGEELLRQYRPDRPARHGLAREEAACARSRAAPPADVVARSEAYGRAVAAHILAWSRDDGGAVVENMGFPLEYKLTPGPAHWVPTSLIAQQQFPLLPDWGKNRTFAMPKGATCTLPAPPEYSEDKSSAVLQGGARGLRGQAEHDARSRRAIARFWSDDAMLSVTPPGHWISIALQILERDECRARQERRCAGASRRRAGGCLHRLLAAKFEYDLVRPITYIRRVIDPKWEPLLNTPPFPEYPSGHSTQSAAAADGADQHVRRQFRLRGRYRHARWPEAAQFPELLGGSRRSGHLAAVWRHPFPRRDRTRPGAGALHRRLCRTPCGRGDRPCVSWHFALALIALVVAGIAPSARWPSRQRRRSRASSRKRRAPASTASMPASGNTWSAAASPPSTATATALPTCCWPAATSPAKFYRNASTRGGALHFEAQTSGLELDKVTGAYPLDIDSDGDHRSGAVARRRKRRDARPRRLPFRARQREPGASTAAMPGRPPLPRPGSMARNGRRWRSATTSTARGDIAVGVVHRQLAAPARRRRRQEPSAVRRALGAQAELLRAFDAVHRLEQVRHAEPAHLQRPRILRGRPGAALARRARPGARLLYTDKEGWKTLRIWGMGIASYDLNADGYPGLFPDQHGRQQAADAREPFRRTVPPKPDYKDVAFAKGVTAHRPYTGGDCAAQHRLACAVRGRQQ